MEWGVCTTVKAPLDQILAFVAWHKHLGASHIWVHLDDADVMASEILEQIDGVTPVLCNKAYWAHNRFRPKTQEARQVYNIQRIYNAAPLPVIGHFDVDEFLWPARPVHEILDDWSDGLPFKRANPAEALYDPTLADDIFTARQFRLPFPGVMHQSRRTRILGDYAPLLHNNMLSHKVGKSLFRTGVEGLKPRLHVGRYDGGDPPIKVPVHPDLIVLHFHAQNYGEWLAALPHRVEKGAYRFNEPLAKYLGGATPSEIEDFYLATQSAHPALLKALAHKGLLVEADLQLKDKVAALL